MTAKEFMALTARDLENGAVREEVARELMRLAEYRHDFPAERETRNHIARECADLREQLRLTEEENRSLKETLVTRRPINGCTPDRYHECADDCETFDSDEQWEKFWQETVAVDGPIDREQVKRELADYSMVLHHASIVISHVTGGRISKPNTFPGVVCALADELESERQKEAIAEALSEQGEAQECWSLIRELIADEADEITISGDNADSGDEIGFIVTCSGEWTDWKDRRFDGKNVLEALRKAAEARRAKG